MEWNHQHIHWLFWLNLIFSGETTEGQSRVIGPSRPILAVVGDDVILPCHIQPATDVSNMLVEWSRPDLVPPNVYIRRDGNLLTRVQHPQYLYRTMLFTEELKKGNASLVIFGVKIADEGKYKCIVPMVNSPVEEPTIQLVVVTRPHISFRRLMNRGVDLQCESTGWNPHPEVEWTDSDGNLLPAGALEAERLPDGFHRVWSRLTRQHSGANRLTCRVHQQHINQSIQTSIQIPDNFYTTSSVCSILTGVIICLVIFILTGASAAFVVWRKLKNKKCNQPDLEMQGAAQTREEKHHVPEHRPLMEQPEAVSSRGEEEEELNPSESGEGKGQSSGCQEGSEGNVLQERENKIKELEDKLTKANENLDKKNTEIQEKDQTIGELREKSEKLEKEIKQLKIKKNEVERHKKKLEKEIGRKELANKGEKSSHNDGSGVSMQQQEKEQNLRKETEEPGPIQAPSEDDEP